MAPLDSLGFDEAWFGEHHSAAYEISGSPELMIAAAAQRTKRIKLGFGVDDELTYNLNADTSAGAIAGAMRAKRLLFLTDVVDPDPVEAQHSGEFVNRRVGEVQAYGEGRFVASNFGQDLALFHRVAFVSMPPSDRRALRHTGGKVLACVPLIEAVGGECRDVNR